MKRKLKDQDKIEMVEKYLLGATLRGLGREYGINHRAVKEILVFRGVEIRKVNTDDNLRVRLRFIYKYVNRVNNKVYVGQTVDPKRRKSEQISGTSLRAGGASLIEASIQKYGIENFDYEIIEQGVMNKLESNARENFYINQLNALVPKGYNIRGSENSIFEANDELREQMGRITQGRARKNENSGSRFVGVWQRSPGVFILSFKLTVNKEKIKFSRTFEDEQTAAEFYDIGMLNFYGNSAKLNFPEKLEEYLTMNLQQKLEELVGMKRHFLYDQYKWIRRRKGKWRLFLPSNPLLRLAKLSPPEMTQIEVAELADKLVFAFHGVPRDELNFPEKINEQDFDILRNELAHYFCFSQKSRYAFIFNESRKRWKAYFWTTSGNIFLGYYKTLGEAELARKSYAEMYREVDPDLSSLKFKFPPKATNILSDVKRVPIYNLD